MHLQPGYYTGCSLGAYGCSLGAYGYSVGAYGCSVGAYGCSPYPAPTLPLPCPYPARGWRGTREALERHQGFVALLSSRRLVRVYVGSSRRQ